MRVGVVGAGRIGANLARQWAGRGHDVVVTGSRDPDRLQAVAEELGVPAAPLAEAVVSADAVLLAVPWAVLDPVAREAATALRGKVLVDATNPFVGGHLVAVPGGSSAVGNERRFPGARLVKAFNTLTAGFQATVGDGRHPAPVALFLAGADAAAKRVAADLVRDAGFEPVDLGGWESGVLLEAPRRSGAVYGEEYRPEAARRIAAMAARDLAGAAHLADALREPAG